MSHIDLLLQGLPLQNMEHLRLITERLTICEAKHKKRRARVQWERKLIANDVWPKDMANKRRITPPTAHVIASTNRALLLPKEPDITIMAMSQSVQAQEEADAVERWTYALLSQKKAWSVFRKQAGELIATGTGIVHIQPDRMALKNKEVPLLLDVPRSENVVWQNGPRGTPSMVFIKHKYTTRELRERFNAAPPRYTRDETQEFECWCYYSEERYIDKETGEVHQMILYGLFHGQQWIVPLTDITLIFGEIPVVVAYNADGWDWEDQEEMHAMGVLTPVNDLLIYAIDYMTQLANSQIRTINPPIVVESNTGATPPVLNLGPLAQNNLVNGEKVRALFDVQPSAQSFQFHQVVMAAIANGTLHQVIEPADDLEGVSGSALAENMNPAQVRLRVQQDSLAEDISREITIMLQYVATRINPKLGMRLFGSDPRDRSRIDVLMQPELLLRHTYVDVKLPSQTPRNVYLMVQLVQGLAQGGIIPTQLAAETIVKWLDLGVSDMTSLMEGLQSDMVRKARLQMAQQAAASLLPHLNQQAQGRGLNIEMFSGGGRQPGGPRLSSEGIDPILAGRAAAARPALPAPQGGV